MNTNQPENIFFKEVIKVVYLGYKILKIKSPLLQLQWLQK